MVRLEKIVLQGFKSFVRKTSIPFPTGFSLITGPNGSGKSNIGDAINFVIGKGSSRLMRARKAHELIFHGSRTKKAAEYANVVLYFDNPKGLLPSEERTVSVGRKINPKGVSTYRLDGRVVTKEQILDFFAQAGLSASGHNIIQQGEVNQIVEMDPVERRGVIDEISGIMEYEDKKKKAAKELEKIEEKVRESEIVLQQKGEVMERLSRDKDSALEYKNLQENLEKIRAALIWKQYKESEKGLKLIIEKLAERGETASKFEAEIRDYDERLEKEEGLFDELTRDVIKASDQIEVSKRLAELRADVELKKGIIESNKREIERLDSMIERLRSVDRRQNPAVKAVLSMKGVLGTLSDLMVVPPKYRVAIDVAGGGHLSDVVVGNTSTAVSCIRYLKDNRVGRARFLPLDKIQARSRGSKPVGSMGWLSSLIHYESKLAPALEYVFGSTACVKDIDTIQQIAKASRVRMVTLDGDLMEAYGAMTGGFYKRGRGVSPDLSKYAEQKRGLQKEIDELAIKLTKMNSEMEELAEKEEKTATTKFERKKVKLDEDLKRVREKRKEVYEKHLTIQQELNQLNLKKVKIETKCEDFKLQWKRYLLELESRDTEKPDKGKGKRPKKPEELEEQEAGIVSRLAPFTEHEVPSLRREERQSIEKLNLLGPVNMKALQDFSSLKDEFDEFKKKVDRIVEEKKSIDDTIAKIEEKKGKAFMVTMTEISKNFRKIYRELTGGDAELDLETPGNVESGLLIKAQPPGKKLLHIDSMSGGEKTLTAFTFLFAIQRYKPAPFYMLDEADATLDAKNTKFVADLIKKQSGLAQFIIISHNDPLIREADQIYGVTMEGGESKVMGIELPPAGNTNDTNNSKNN